MKNYLKEFFKKIELEKEDADYLLQVYDKINNDLEMSSIWKEIISLYDKEIYCDYIKMLSVADEIANKLYLKEYTTELLMFLCLTKRAEKIYEERGIPQDIFINTMRDFKYKIEECKLVKGVVGMFVPNWYIGNFLIARFALGRLQFEVNDFNRNYTKDGKTLTPESKVLGIHIPRSGKPLTKEECDISFDMAKEFFKETIGDTCAFTCGSWLLYPENEKILSHDSNVYRFMKRFDIIESKTLKENIELWRLFDTDEKNPDRLPTNTSMQRAYVEHLKKGGKTGTGFGVFFW